MGGVNAGAAAGVGVEGAGVGAAGAAAGGAGAPLKSAKAAISSLLSTITHINCTKEDYLVLHHIGSLILDINIKGRWGNIITCT